MFYEEFRVTTCSMRSSEFRVTTCSMRSSEWLHVLWGVQSSEWLHVLWGVQSDDMFYEEFRGQSSEFRVTTCSMRSSEFRVQSDYMYTEHWLHVENYTNITYHLPVPLGNKRRDSWMFNHSIVHKLASRHHSVLTPNEYQNDTQYTAVKKERYGSQSAYSTIVMAPSHISPPLWKARPCTSHTGVSNSTSPSTSSDGLLTPYVAKGGGRRNPRGSHFQSTFRNDGIQPDWHKATWT